MTKVLAEIARMRNLTAYLLSLVIPGYSFLFVVTGPHSITGTVLWILPMWSTVLIDLWSPPNRKAPQITAHRLAYDGILYLLAGLQFLTILGLFHFAGQLDFGNSQAIARSLLSLFAIKVIVGTSSSFSGIVVAHELIHRPERFKQTLGRMLLALECYEHFATEHIRGHHKAFGTPQDPATARAGESYEQFWRRTLPAQLINALKLENQRLKGQGRLFRLGNNRVVQGLILELVLLLSIGLCFGGAGLVVFAVQAIAAVRKLEAVNYIEHFALGRKGAGLGHARSWDTDSWFTLHAMVGLSRHSDHHRHAAKPYYCLRYCADSPKLPYGYFTSVFLAVNFNRYYRRLIQRELERLELASSPRRRPGKGRRERPISGPGLSSISGD